MARAGAGGGPAFVWTPARARRYAPPMVWRIVAACVLWLACSGPAGAMTVEAAPDEALAAEADLVVHAQVVARDVERAPGRAMRLRTRYRLVVWDIIAARGTPRLLLGGPLPELEVVMPGGSRGGLTTVVPGVPSLLPGEELLLLLSDTPWGYQPIGYSLGTWRIHDSGTSPAHGSVKLSAHDSGSVPGGSPPGRTHDSGNFPAHDSGTVRDPLGTWRNHDSGTFPAHDSGSLPGGGPSGADDARVVPPEALDALVTRLLGRTWR